MKSGGDKPKRREMARLSPENQEVPARPAWIENSPRNGFDFPRTAR